MAYNFPDAPVNNDTVTTAGRLFKWVAAKTRWEYEGLAPLNPPGGVAVPGTNTWNDAATTLTSTDCVQLSTNNTTWSQSIAPTTGPTFYTRWDPSAACDGAPSGTTITGTITDNTTGASETYSKVTGKSPFPGTVTTPTTAGTANTGGTCFTWDSGADTIYGTGCLEFNVNGGGFTQANTAVVDGDTVCTRWQSGTGVGTTCADAVDGSTITGTLESATYIQNASLTLDRQPNAFDFTDQTGIATSTAVTSNTITLSGLNADSYLQITPDATNPLTTIQASINGGAYAAVPAAGTYTLVVKNGDTITLQGTTGASVSTGYKLTAIIGDSVGSTSDLWTVTTSAAVPTVSTPTITAPTDGATSIDLSPIITSSAYSALNGAGTHATSDWELYSDAALTTLVDSSIGDATNLTSWTPTASLSLNTTYYVRVRYNDNTTPTAVSSGYSAASSFTTKATLSFGDPFGGGYFAGVIRDSFSVGATNYNLIVAPITEGSLEGQYGGAAATGIQWKTSTTASTNASSTSDGTLATTSNANAFFPIFDWAVNSATGPNAGTFDATNTTGTGIGGYNDWYIPARYEMEIIYRRLKPDATANSTGYGTNFYAQPTTGSNYTSTNPTTTTASIFQAGGSQAYTPALYWTATESSALYVYNTQMDRGEQSGTTKTGAIRARAVRRVPV